MIALGLCASVCVVELAIWHSPVARGAASANNAAAAEQKIRTLQRDLLTVLRQARSMLMDGYKTGEIDFSRVLEGNVQLLRAELDACNTEAQKIKVLEQIADTYKELDEVALRLFRAGQGQATDQLAAKAKLIETEIAIERLRLKSSASSKS
jgi:outer membrane protein TolC